VFDLSSLPLDEAKALVKRADESLKKQESPRGDVPGLASKFLDHLQTRLVPPKCSFFPRACHCLSRPPTPPPIYPTEEILIYGSRHLALSSLTFASGKSISPSFFKPPFSETSLLSCRQPRVSRHDGLSKATSPSRGLLGP